MFILQARREKISERMKVLQDLVPGCNKVHFDLNMHSALFVLPHVPFLRFTPSKCLNDFLFAWSGYWESIST